MHQSKFFLDSLANLFTFFFRKTFLIHPMPASTSLCSRGNSNSQVPSTGIRGVSMSGLFYFITIYFVMQETESRAAVSSEVTLSHKSYCINKLFISFFTRLAYFGKHL